MKAGVVVSLKRVRKRSSQKSTDNSQPSGSGVPEGTQANRPSRYAMHVEFLPTANALCLELNTWPGVVLVGLKKQSLIEVELSRYSGHLEKLYLKANEESKC